MDRNSMVLLMKRHRMKKSTKNLVIFGLLLLILNSEAIAQQKGRWVNSQVTSDSLIMTNLLFADSNVGYFSGYKWVSYVDRTDGISSYRKSYYFRTTDGGTNWMPISFGKYSPPEDIDVWKHSFTFPDRGYSIIIATPSVAYLNAVYKNSDSVYVFTLLKTTNSGLTWLPVQTLQGQYVNARKFFSEKFGFGYDFGSRNEPAKLVYTVDGGIRWFDLPGRTTYNYQINGVNYTFNSLYLDEVNYGFIDSTHLMFIPTSNHFSSSPSTDSIPNSPTYGITSFLTTDRGSNWAISNWNDPLIPKLSINTADTFFANGRLKTVKKSQSVFRFMLSGEYNGAYSEDGRDDQLALLPSGHFSNSNNGGDSITPGGGGNRYYSNPRTTYYHTTNYGEAWVANRSFLGRTRDMVATTPDDIWMTTRTKPFENDTVIVFGRYLKDTLINGTRTVVFDSGWHKERDLGISKKNLGLYASWIVHSTDGGTNWDIDSLSLHDQEVGEYDSRIIRSTDPNHLWIGAMKNGYSYVFRYKAPGVNAVTEEIPSADYPNFINIYPNPAREKVTIALWRHAGIKQIRLFDILGREIKAPALQLTQSSFELDVSSVPPGPYILVCDITGGTNLAKTILVMR